jgi:hypothetical protein
MFALGLIAGVPVACAQEVSAYLGLGSAHDSRNGLQINTFGDGTLYRAPTLGGLFADLGASVFFNRKIGAGAEIAWRPSQGDYAGIKYRPSIYSFDGIFRPLTGRAQRFEPEFRAGIGGARVRYFFDDPSSCDQVPGCPDASHFQVHLAVATRIYLADHFFLRPAFDLHYVNHLSEFGSNWAPRYSFGLGYSLGRE